MMVKLNSRNYKRILEHYLDALRKLNNSYSLLKEGPPPRFIEICEDAFKANLFELFQVFEDYMAYSLKTYGISVSEISVQTCIVKLAELGRIDDVLAKNLTRFKILRHRYAHRYGEPTLNDMLSFYEESKESLSSQRSIIEKLVKEEEEKNQKKRESKRIEKINCFEEEQGF